MSNIVPVNSLLNAQTGLTAPVEGLDNVSIKPSQIRLVQQGSAGAGETLQVGKLVDTLSGNHFSSMIAVPLAIKTGRVLFPANQNVGGNPRCRSNDGIVPAPNVPERQASRCDICDHGPKLWKTWRQTGIMPDCKETRNLLFIDRESGFPYFLTIKSSGIKLFEQIKSSIFRDIVMNRPKGNNLALYDYTFEIKPTRVSGAKGNYYILNFVNLQKVAQPGEYAPLYDMFVRQNQALDNDEAVEGAIDAEFSDVSQEVEYVAA